METGAVFDISKYLTDNVLETKDVFGDLTDYSKGQQNIISDFKQTQDVDNQSYYVFLTDARSSTGQGGYMPLGGQFGFVFFSENEGIGRTIAHELGHGIFRLPHPFKKKSDAGKTLSVMDYGQGEAFLFPEWQQINDPKLKIGVFQGQDEGEIYSLKNSPLMVRRYIEYFRCVYRQKGTIYSTPDKVDVYAEDIEIGEKKYNRIEITFLGKNNQEFKNSFSPKEYQNDSKEIDNSFTNRTIVTLGKTIRFTLYPKNNLDLIGYLYSNDTSHTEAVRRDFVDFVTKKTEDEVVGYINSIDICTLSELDFEHIKQALIVLAKNSIGKDKTKAILRLVNSIAEKNYPDFFHLMEANDNQIIKKLINGLDDSLIGDDYYTQFVTAVVRMFVSNPDTWLGKLPKDEDAVAEYFTDHYLRKPEAGITHIEELINGNSHIIWQSFYYDKETGDINIQQNISKIQALGGINGKVAYAPSGAPQLLKNTRVSPLSPVLFDYSRGEVQPVKILLDNAGYSSGDLVIVPAIFLQFGYDKIKANTIEKSTLLALNGLTVYTQLPAVVQGATMSKRLWAAAEVAAAVGDIAVNTAGLSPEVQKVVDTYNLAMGIIGVKNVAVGGYKFVGNLPQATKTLLQENKRLRDLLVGQYLDYRIAITKLKNSDNWGNLPVEVRQNIAKQENVLIDITDAKNIPNDNWGVPDNVFINGKTKQDILTIPKGERPLPETYLSSSYIQQHLAKFNEGAVRFTSRAAFNKYATLGPDGGFILPKDYLDDILKEANGNLGIIEQKLGLEKGYLSSDDIMIVYIKRQNLTGLRMPSGNESGANPLWLPGGYTSGYIPEAVMDFSTKPTFLEIKLK
ncbi:MAG: hypothetical protein Q4G16_07810 [Cruoricaptor ignavus]|nr:hypothetical protein [Cruoricaptor ignavus]